eukprot:gene5903-18728_t
MCNPKISPAHAPACEESVILAIKGTFNTFRRAIVQQEKALCTAAEAESRRKRGAANDQHTSLDNAESRIDAVTAFGAWVLGGDDGGAGANAKPEVFLEARAPLVRALNRLLAEDIAMLPVVSPMIAFGGNGAESIVAAIAAFGGVSGVDADAAASVAAGAGLTGKPTVGAATTFTVDLRASDGEPVDVQDEHVLVSMATATVTADTTPVPTILPATATKTGDAQVTFAFTPVDEAALSVDVKVLGAHVGGSPFAVQPVKGVVVLLKLWGAGGAGGQHSNGNHGGAGGFISGTFLWTPGDVLTVVVGAGGTTHTYGGGGGTRVETAEGGGLPNGGHARGNYDSGGGGGSTHILSSSNNDEVVLGAGGGGGGSGGKASGSGGGGGGGTRDGVVGNGGNGDHNGTANMKDEMPSTSGGGAGGAGHRAGVPKDGANANGAGGLCATSKQSGSGFGGGGGSCSRKHVALEEPAVHNATNSTAPNSGDPHFAGGQTAKGSANGRGAGGAGQAVVVFVGSDRAPLIFTEAGTHAIPFPTD